VLARGGELNDHLPVQVVRHNHTHDVDVLGLGDGRPARVVSLEAITPRRVARQVFIDVRHRHEADGWQAGREHCPGRPIPVCVSAAGHASAYDGDAEGIGHQDSVKLINAEIRSPDRPLTLPDLQQTSAMGHPPFPSTGRASRERQ